MLSPSIDEDDLIVSDVTLGEALMHFATIGWKLLFAFIPPVEWGGGWPAFFVALTFIGTITAVVAEVATVLGCTLGLEEAVTAITLVAVGTSLPDTFASMTAARTSPYADSAIGNVTGSNSVNVFVGLGLPWLISSIYQSNRNVPYLTPPGNLAFSVMLFLITSLICFFILILRRLVRTTYIYFFLIIIFPVSDSGWRARWTLRFQNPFIGDPIPPLGDICVLLVAESVQSHRWHLNSEGDKERVKIFSIKNFNKVNTNQVSSLPFITSYSFLKVF